MPDQSLIKSQSAVTPWASRQDVREMEERLRTMLPGAQKLSAMELFGLAQASIAHNLDPFNGELWCIPKKGLMAGIKGHRRAAHRQINEEAGGNGNYYVEFFQISIDEMSSLKIPTRALAFRALLHDSQTTRSYVENIERVLKAGMPWEVASKIFGEQPFTEGIGYAMPDSPDKDCPTCKGTGKTINKWGDKCMCSCYEESGMTVVQRAQKRAEAEALKRRFDLPFTMAIGVNGDADVIDAEFTVGKQAQPEQSPSEVQARMQAASNALRGDQGDGLVWNEQLAPDTTSAPSPTAPEAQPAQPAQNTQGVSPKSASIKPRYWTGETIKTLREQNPETPVQEIVARLNKSKRLDPKDPLDVFVKWMVRYAESRAHSEPDAAASWADEMFENVA